MRDEVRGRGTRQITLFEVAVVYIVCGAIGWVAIGKFGGFFGGGAIGMLPFAGLIWLRRSKRKYVTPPPAKPP